MGAGSAICLGNAKAAIHCPLLRSIDLAMAKGMVVMINAGISLMTSEFVEVSHTILDVEGDATVLVGVVIHLQMEDELRVTIVATGLDDRQIAAATRDAIMRRKEECNDAGALRTIARTIEDGPDDYLDIPAFMRRQTG